METLCIIPARGGSKRILKKNIKPFLGRPILAYSIEAALESGVFDEVMVSTDDLEIAAVAERYEAKVPFMRSSGNADDFATTADVLLEVLEVYSKSGREFTKACCLYPTAPFVMPNHLQKGYEQLLAQQRAVVFPVAAFSYPIWRSLRQVDDGRVEMIWPEHLNARSQDLPQAYHDAGQWYWFDVEALRASRTLFGDNSSVLVLDGLGVQDIDTLDDWKLAEIKFEYLQSVK